MGNAAEASVREDPWRSPTVPGGSDRGTGAPSGRRGPHAGGDLRGVTRPGGSTQGPARREGGVENRGVQGGVAAPAALRRGQAVNPPWHAERTPNAPKGQMACG